MLTSETAHHVKTVDGTSWDEGAVNLQLKEEDLNDYEGHLFASHGSMSFS